MKKRNFILIILTLIIISTINFPRYAGLITKYPSKIPKSTAIKIERFQVSTPNTWWLNGIEYVQKTITNGTLKFAVMEMVAQLSHGKMREVDLKMI